MGLTCLGSERGLKTEEKEVIKGSMKIKEMAVSQQENPSLSPYAFVHWNFRDPTFISGAKWENWGLGGAIGTNLLGDNPFTHVAGGLFINVFGLRVVGGANAIPVFIEKYGKIHKERKYRPFLAIVYRL